MKISICTPSIRPAGLAMTKKCLEQQTFTDFEWLVEVGLEKHDLNAAYNRMIRRAKGEIFVSLQDFIKVRPDYLQRWADAYEKHPNSFMTAPVGKVNDLDGGELPRWDWRASLNDPNDHERLTDWNTWEIDSAAAPMAALRQIGGFDEALDGVWSSDNVNVGCRAELAGYEFRCIFDNPGIAWDHDLFVPHPHRSTFDGTLNTKRMAMFRGGKTLEPL